MRPAPLLAALALPVFAASARADNSPATWFSAEIRADPTVWSVNAPDAAGRIFTCIAPECDGRPEVYGRAWPAKDRKDALAEACGSLGRHGETGRFLTGSGSLGAAMGFKAFASWSGCRAMDSPILEACGATDGVAYRLTTAIVDGCNRSPEMPEDRFVDLLRSIVPSVPAAIGSE